jgi:hypothetical protein
VQAPGITPENRASPVAAAGELTPENMELPCQLLLSRRQGGGYVPGGDLGDQFTAEFGLDEDAATE